MHLSLFGTLQCCVSSLARKASGYTLVLCGRSLPLLIPQISYAFRWTILPISWRSIKTSTSSLGSAGARRGDEPGSRWFNIALCADHSELGCNCPIPKDRLSRREDRSTGEERHEREQNFRLDRSPDEPCIRSIRARNVRVTHAERSTRGHDRSPRQSIDRSKRRLFSPSRPPCGPGGGV